MRAKDKVGLRHVGVLHVVLSPQLGRRIREGRAFTIQLVLT